MKKSLLLILALMFTAVISKAQIPNAGFESWTNMGSYNNPDAWGCLNNTTASWSTYTCVRGTPGNPGTAYLKLISRTITGLGVVPGVAVSGTINTVTCLPEDGFPFAQRPQNLEGIWQHMIFGTSQGFVDVQLTRWDAPTQSRITVASAHELLSGMAMSWTGFTIPLVYSDPNYPDTCMLILSASGSTPTNNDYLYIDNLSFTGTVTGIRENKNAADIAVYPNPASGTLTVDVSALNDKEVSFQIVDMQGRTVLAKTDILVSAPARLDLSDLPKGNYILYVQTSRGVLTKNFTRK